MKYGFIKVRAIAPELRVADVPFNTQTVIEALDRADCDGVQLLVTPAFSLCGATCGALFLQDALLNACLNSLAQIVSASEGKEPMLFVGLPMAIEGKTYACVAAVKDGKLLAVIPKQTLSSSRLEQRYFARGSAEVKLVELFGELVPFGGSILLKDTTVSAFTVACEVGEDGDLPYAPHTVHAEAGANIIVQPSCGAELCSSATERVLRVTQTSKRLACGYICAEAGVGESTAGCVYGGHQIISENGELLAEAKPFSGGVADSEIDVELIACERRRNAEFCVDEGEYVIVPFTSAERAGELSRRVDKSPLIPDEGEFERILQIQAHGLKERLSRTRSKTAVIGVSGGLDSALAFLVTVRAFDLMGKDRADILAYTMPGFGTTARTKNNSLKLMKEMGATAKTVNIVPTVKRHFLDIGHDERVTDVTYENAQARVRTLILMDVANKTGGLVVGTGDMSELALGWCTYNGDHMSNYAVNSGVCKTLVKALTAYEGKRLGGRVEAVVQSIVNTEISPELLPPDAAGNIAQKTEDLVGPYELHDFYLYYCVRYAFPPEKIYYLAQKAFDGQYSSQTLKKWLKNFYRRFFTQQFKRSCSPDGVQVCPISLSPTEWTMPSDAVASVWLNEVESL